jgi:hypothetical protein
MNIKKRNIKNVQKSIGELKQTKPTPSQIKPTPSYKKVKSLQLQTQESATKPKLVKNQSSQKIDYLKTTIDSTFLRSSSKLETPTPKNIVKKAEISLFPKLEDFYEDNVNYFWQKDIMKNLAEQVVFTPKINEAHRKIFSDVN